MDALQLIANQEGYRQFAYRDTMGKLTIGNGRNLDSEGVSRAEAAFLLNQDLARVTAKLSALPFWNELSPVRQAVLQSVAINCGMAGMLDFHVMLQHLTYHDYGKAAAALLNSKAARECPNRYKQLAEMLTTGQWPIE